MLFTPNISWPIASNPIRPYSLFSVKKWTVQEASPLWEEFSSHSDQHPK